MSAPSARTVATFFGVAEASVSMYTAAFAELAECCSTILAGVARVFLLMATITTWLGLAFSIDA